MIEINRCEEKIFLWGFTDGTLKEIIELRTPWPPRISVHPWSKDLVIWCAICIGNFINFCVDIWVKNHIMQEK